MLNVELAGWMAVFLAVAVLAAFLLEEALRYAFRSFRLARILAKSRAEALPARQATEAARGRGAELPAAPGIHSFPLHFPGSPPGTALDARK